MRETNQRDVAVQSQGEAHELAASYESREVAVSSTEDQNGSTRAWLRVFGSFLIFMNIWCA